MDVKNGMRFFTMYQQNSGQKHGGMKLKEAGSSSDCWFTSRGCRV